MCSARFGSQGHTHPAQSVSSLQDFFTSNYEFPLDICICKADEMWLRRAKDGKYKGELVPRWVRRELKKKNASCCPLPGCSDVAPRPCTFTITEVLTACDIAIEDFLLLAHLTYVIVITKKFPDFLIQIVSQSVLYVEVSPSILIECTKGLSPSPNQKLLIFCWQKWVTLVNLLLPLVWHATNAINFALG